MRSAPLLLLVLLLVLVLLAGAARAGTRSACEQLAGGTEGVRARAVSVRGAARGVLLYWGAAPARAAAALLRAALLALRYTDVRLAQGPHSLVRLAAHVAARSHGHREVALALAAGWAGEPRTVCDERGEQCEPATCEVQRGEECGAAGPRLRELGASGEPARARLLLHLSAAAARRAACAGAAHWPLYADGAPLAECDLLGAHPNRSGRGRGPALVYYVAEPPVREAAERLRARAAAAGLPLHLQPLGRAALLAALRGNSSFLFLDHDMWSDGDSAPARVRPATPPPCVGSACAADLDPAVSIRAADVDTLTTFAPHLFDTFLEFNPSTKLLRTMLQREAEGAPIEEAACRWAERAERHPGPAPKVYHQVWAMLCNDSDTGRLQQTLREVGAYLGGSMIINIGSVTVDCSDERALSDAIFDSLVVTREGTMVPARRPLHWLVGLVAGGGRALARTAGALARRLPLVQFDEGLAAAPLWTSAGSPRDLALVLRHFVTQHRWTRLAVLTDGTPTASEWFRVLGAEGLALREFRVPGAPSADDAGHVLAQLREVDGRVVFVNKGPDAAAAILSAAVAAGMARDDRFAWILREWRPTNESFPLRHFTVSYGCSGSAGGLPASARRRSWKQWSPRAVALADAVLTVANGFQAAVARAPHTLFDLQAGDSYLKEFERALQRGVGRGVQQELRYEAGSRVRAALRMCVDAWRGAAREPLGECCVLDGELACSLRSPFVGGGAPADGARACVARAGDPFWPHCYDAAWIAALALAPLAALAAHRYLKWRRRRATSN